MLKTDYNHQDSRKYTGSVSVIARLDFEIKTDSLEEAKEKILSSSSQFNLEAEDGSEIKILAQDWDFIIEYYSDTSIPHLYNFKLDEEK